MPLYLQCLVFHVMHYVCSTNGKENKCNLQPHAVLSKGALLYHSVCLSAIKTTAMPVNKSCLQLHLLNIYQHEFKAK